MHLEYSQERAQMRRQRQLEEQAEAARRSRVAVTIDLLGRRVRYYCFLSVVAFIIDLWQRQLEEWAEAARRSCVAVTIYLLGCRVRPPFFVIGSFIAFNHSMFHRFSSRHPCSSNLPSPHRSLLLMQQRA